MTTIFIIIMFAMFIVFDVIVLVKNKQTITSVMRKWYKTMPLVPFMFGGLFIGHFGLANIWTIPLPKLLSIGIFIGLAVSYMIYCIVQRIRDAKKIQTGKVWQVSKKIFLLPMILGSIVGWFWS